MSHLPKIGAVLSEVVAKSGYRPLIDGEGLAKDLDDLARENRVSSNYVFLCDIETTVEDGIREDCGVVWANRLRDHWTDTKLSLRLFTQEWPLCISTDKAATRSICLHYGGKSLALLFEQCLNEACAPEKKDWLKIPFSAWVALAARTCNVSENTVLDNIANKLNIDSKTVNERWYAKGKVIGRIKWPMKDVVEAVTRSANCEVDSKMTQHLAGWLLLSVAFQSSAKVIRETVSAIFNNEETEPYPLPSKDSIDIRNIFNQTILIDELLCRQGNLSRIKKELTKQKETLLKSAPEAIYLYHRNAGKYEAIQGEVEKASQHYKKAVEKSWWVAGPFQQVILKESLLFAVGTGDKVMAEKCWDRVFMLGLKEGTKPPLDIQQLRELTFAFKYMFPNLASKQKVQPAFEIELIEEVFSLTPTDIKNPNQKRKYLEGQVVRTPFMQTIRRGSLEDVKSLVEDDPAREHRKNGDPNDFVKESGYSPLMESMWRAQNRKEPEIMRYLISLELKPETVNRETSTRRETPLSVAIEMGDVETLKRLIELGADIHAPCGGADTALLLATMLAAMSRSGIEKLLPLLSGGSSRIDVTDAKAGLVFDQELQDSRGAQFQMMLADRPLLGIVKEEFKHMQPSMEQLIPVIETLLEHGADPNQRYQTPGDPQHEWTPTLHAAQIGHLELFRLLIENTSNPGDPTSLLDPASSDLIKKDAYWVAVLYKRDAIIQYLSKYRHQTL